MRTPCLCLPLTGLCAHASAAACDATKISAVTSTEPELRVRETALVETPVPTITSWWASAPLELLRLSGAVASASGSRAPAGALALAWQRGDFGPMSVQQKPEGAGPVTLADQQTEALIVRQIRERFPRDEIVGEESGYHEGRASAPRWFIDPIDGTRDFAAGGPDWAVHVGLCEGDAVTMGVVFQPRAARLTWGVLEGTPRAGVVDDMGRGK